MRFRATRDDPHHRRGPSQRADQIGQKLKEGHQTPVLALSSVVQAKFSPHTTNLFEKFVSLRDSRLVPLLHLNLNRAGIVGDPIV
jgi:hypothetical protein